MGGPCQFYTIQLTLGQTLNVTIGQSNYYTYAYSALPNAGYQSSDWNNITGPVFAGQDGLYSVKACDSTQGSGIYYRYTVTFTVH